MSNSKIKYSHEERLYIHNYFENLSLENLFYRLAEASLAYTDVPHYTKKTNILGIGAVNQFLRFYINKSSKGFVIKFKCEEASIPFRVQDEQRYMEIIEKNSIMFQDYKFPAQMTQKQTDNSERSRDLTSNHSLSHFVSENRRPSVNRPDRVAEKHRPYKSGKSPPDMISPVRTLEQQQIYEEANAILNSVYGKEAEFREGQYEAIEATILHNRTLVVQKTGWGKSLVYFICTRILRNRGRGVTMVISPLLVLMDNQQSAAVAMGLKSDLLNSRVKERREDIIEAVKNNELDMLFITPETLFAEDVQEALPEIRIGLFVIDEVHCISDWGHDFRLDYGNLYKILQKLPGNVPVLGTTATANDRVIEDLKAQIGQDLFISRGPLARDSLEIQIVNLEKKNERYAWILQHINDMQGSGIIYCLTQRECDYLADFLKKNGIQAFAYHSGLDEEKQTEAEELFKYNQIKALVATVKLGMGYDKGDIAFIIHFQCPSNIVSYYQQIGRAGRNIPKAYAILMHGKEDDDIINYFIDTAFPSEKECREILQVLRNADGAKYYDIAAEVNIRKGRMDKALMFMENEGYLYKEKSQYYAAPKRFVYDRAHYEAVTEIRRRERAQMIELTHVRSCYSKFITECLDDPWAEVCGHCSACQRRELISSDISMEYLNKATSYLERLTFSIEPRKRWARSSVTSAGKIEYQNQKGICLSRYGDPGYGELVKRDKYNNRYFCAELIGKSVEVLKPFIREHQIHHITFVPSRRSRMVALLAEEIASRCHLQLMDLLEKSQAPQQKTMENSAHQCENAYNSFHMKTGVSVPRRILLIDDIVDSKWTLTVCGYRLMEHGCEEVYPFALADSSER